MDLAGNRTQRMLDLSVHTHTHTHRQVIIYQSGQAQHGFSSQVNRPVEVSLSSNTINIIDPGGLAWPIKHIGPLAKTQEM